MPQVKNLAIARAGDGSRHETWLSRPEKKNFDLLVSYYGDEPDRWRPRSDRYDRSKGLKFPWFNAFLDSNPWVFEYDAVWLCDDDIEADTAVIADMFDIFNEKGLWIGQPALTRGSVHSFGMLLCNPGKLLRYTEFIEEQVPIFSKEALAKVRHTFGDTQSGAGIGIPWPHILGFPSNRLAVIDATPVAHRRSLQSGEMYTKVLPSMGISAAVELDHMKKKYGDSYHVGVYRGVIELDPADPKTPERRARQEIL
jgi:hypothetical protein